MMSRQREYWRFFWPLSLDGIVLLLGQQFQNAVLARYPESERELAVYAVAGGLIFLFNSSLVFLPQLVNVYARSEQGRRRTLQFIVIVCLLMSLPMAWSSLSGIGRRLLGRLYGLEETMLQATALYLAYLSPLVLLGGLRCYFSGLLIQSKMTGWVTINHILYLLVQVGLLILGLRSGWRAVETVVLGNAAASFGELALSAYACTLRPPSSLPDKSSIQVTFQEMFAFFWPTAVTSLMFALSRPVIFSFIARSGDATPILAALRVGFDFGMLFFVPMNQFRHVYVTFGDEDAQGIKRFAITVMTISIALMLLVSLTPLSRIILGELLGVRGDLLVMARETILVMCLIPAFMTLRNFYHGRLLRSRKTVLMGVGGLSRIVIIYTASWLFWQLDWLDHRAAAFILGLGFLAEALTVSRTSLSRNQ